MDKLTFLVSVAEEDAILKSEFEKIRSVGNEVLDSMFVGPDLFYEAFGNYFCHDFEPRDPNYFEYEGIHQLFDDYLDGLDTADSGSWERIDEAMHPAMVIANCYYNKLTRTIGDFRHMLDTDNLWDFEVVPFRTSDSCISHYQINVYTRA